jgi:hypothetical protein
VRLVAQLRRAYARLFTTTHPPVVIYCRRTDGGCCASPSLGEQLRACEHYAQRHGLTIVERITEETHA